MNLYIKHRPQDLNDIIGNEAVVLSLCEIMRKPIEKRPHVYLFEGDYGTGKTTLARILASSFETIDNNIITIDAGTHRKVESADKLKKDMRYRPIHGQNKIFIIDEVQTTSGSKFMESLLHTLEDGCPDYIYFIFCTTDAHKINKGIIDRSVIFSLTKYTIRQLILILENVCRKEEKEIDKGFLRKIAVKANGSARGAINLLEKIITVPKEELTEEFLSKIEITTANDGIEIAKLLITRKNWKSIVEKLRKTTDTPEVIKTTIMNYCSGVLLNSLNPNKERAFQIMTALIGVGNISKSELIYFLAFLS